MRLHALPFPPLQYFFLMTAVQFLTNFLRLLVEQLLLRLQLLRQELLTSVQFLESLLFVSAASLILSLQALRQELAGVDRTGGGGARGGAPPAVGAARGGVGGAAGSLSTRNLAVEHFDRRIVVARTTLEQRIGYLLILLVERLAVFPLKPLRDESVDLGSTGGPGAVDATHVVARSRTLSARILVVEQFDRIIVVVLAGAKGTVLETKCSGFVVRFR
jgi:hypothetical protein